MRMKNIILIGMPACGKSSVGVILAKTAAISANSANRWCSPFIHNIRTCRIRKH